MTKRQLSHAERMHRICTQCGQPFFVFMVDSWDDGHPVVARSGAINAMDENGLFCKLRCAARWAVEHAELNGIRPRQTA